MASGLTSGLVSCSKPKSNDPSWKYCEPTAEVKRVICNYCGLKMSGGINRFKYHLAKISGKEVQVCQVPPEVQREMVAYLADYVEKKEEKKRKADALTTLKNKRTARDDSISISDRYDVGASSLGDRGQGRLRGSPLGDSSGCSKSFIVLENSPGAQPSLENTVRNHELHNKAMIAATNFLIYNNIPFNVTESSYWENMVTAFTVAGKGFKAPTPHYFSGPLLDDAVKNTNGIVNEHKKIWHKKGCSILCYGWTDGENRTLINFLVDSNGQVVFLKSIDASNQVKNANMLYDMLDKVVNEVGVENVVQVVTENATIYVEVGRLLEERHPTLNWTPCVAHCINLLLEDVGKIIGGKNIVEARNITEFIYNHPSVLNLMIEHTNGKELVRGGVTRFTTNFIILHSIATSLTSLKQMFESRQWLESPYANKPEGKRVMNTIFNEEFAKHIDEILKVSEPLVRVLHMVNGKKNRMGYLYEAMDVAKEAIAKYYDNIKEKYEPIWKVIDERWNKQLYWHIHAAAYYLNPKYFYSDSFKANEEVMYGLNTCIERMIPDERTRYIIADELQIYKSAEGRLFSSALCIRRRNTARPDLWWEDYGAKTPNLQRLAIRILCQPCSFSRCERNGSLFEAIHTKKRNKLTTQQLIDLVFVRCNLRLRERQVEGAESHDAIDLEDIDPYGDGIAELDPIEDPMSIEEEIAAPERKEEEGIASGAAEAPCGVGEYAKLADFLATFLDAVLEDSRTCNMGTTSRSISTERMVCGMSGGDHFLSNECSSNLSLGL